MQFVNLPTNALTRLLRMENVLWSVPMEKLQIVFVELVVQQTIKSTVLLHKYVRILQLLKAFAKIFALL